MNRRAAFTLVELLVVAGIFAMLFGLVLNGGNVTFAQPTNALLAANLNGPGTLTKAGGNSLTVAGSAAGFSGTINVQAGTLRAGNTNALASTVNVASGGTLDVNGQWLPNANVTANGLGTDGFGALNNRGLGRTNALANLTLAGHTTVGARVTTMQNALKTYHI